MIGSVVWNDETIGIGHFKFHSLADTILTYYMQVNANQAWKHHGNKFLDHVNSNEGRICYECLPNLCNWDGAF